MEVHVQHEYGKRKRSNSESETWTLSGQEDTAPRSPTTTGTTKEANENGNGKESPVGHQTPHSSKPKTKEQKESKTYPLTPLRGREIPLPAVSWADTNELSLLMCFKEDINNRSRDPEVFKRHPNLTPRMRSILLDWLMEVCEVYKLRRITYYLAVDYIDRYLSNVDELPKHQLQLLGITCLFIAAKVEEIYPPKLMELAYVTDGACTDQEMLMKEIAVLKVLKWDVSPMTVSSWLYLYMQISFGIKNIRHKVDTSQINNEFIYPQFSSYAFMRASQLVDLCSLDAGMLKFQYSIIATCAMYFMFSRERALYVSGFTWDQITDCINWMLPFAEVINHVRLVNPMQIPKENLRNGSGLKKTNPKILLDESHTLQNHVVGLEMLEEVYHDIANPVEAAIKHLSQTCVERDDAIEPPDTPPEPIETENTDQNSESDIIECENENSTLSPIAETSSTQLQE